MSKTQKTRKGPTESATQFSVGTIKKGNDGNKWKITQTSSGIHRWSKLTSIRHSSYHNHHNRTVKNTSKTTTLKEGIVSLTRLKQIGNKNTVSTAGKSKSQIAEILFNIRGNALSARELQEIHNLLPSKQKKEARDMIATQIETPVTDYKGMWRPAPKPLHDMTRREMINSLRKFRDAWDKHVGRNQDLSDERLAGETDKGLRERLKYYYSDTAKHQAANWIREETQ
jgi:hypothetical protein